ncbi:MAG: hydantoinase/oxoprolinase family protein [Acidovorax sp.]|uniref:hydantoinase/oxoprolinase family protein n=1 Tax=Acidovorax sp. TaxID=1872122 RepID=UPI00391CEB7D
MTRIGFDIGGTFTDFALERPGRPLIFHKVSSTPGNPAEAVSRGIKELIALASAVPAEVEGVLHATTVATNAILERKGARTALITTAGFRDIVLLGRQKRYDVFDLHLKKSQPLVQRRDIFEIAERLLHDGTVVTPLVDAGIDQIIEKLKDGGYASVAVCFLHSFVNPEHEQRVCARIRQQVPGIAVTASSDVSPRYREYERTSTTVANAYVQPPVRRYVDQLQAVLKQAGLDCGLSIMQSNGGLVSPEMARNYPVRIVESGPAAGVLMCAEVGKELGLDQILTFDMGGTTAKLGAIDHGRPSISPTFEVDMVRFLKGSGLPLNISSIELLEIGAGGGSIASLEMGLIKIGPHSAGSDPGPMCYGRGGELPTVTDANVVLGYLDPANFNGGAIQLDAAASERGIRETIADPLGISAGRAAWGVYAMVSSNMERALRIVSIERGRDPRDYAMIAFGGAGPVHAARLARQVGVRRVVIPHGAGVGSAVGLLRARPKVDASVTRIIEVGPAHAESITAVFAELRNKVVAELEQMGARADELIWTSAVHMRYRGQGHDLRVELEQDSTQDGFLAYLVDRFQEAYKRNFGYSEVTAATEATEWYLAAEWEDGNHEGAGVPALMGEQKTRVRKTRMAYFPEADDYSEVQVVDRGSLSAGERVVGPAIIEEREATTVILKGDVASIGHGGHLIIDIAGE